MIANTDVRKGTLNVSLLDLTTQQVTFQQDAVHDLGWPKLKAALNQAGPNIIDIHSLENRRQNAPFFVAQVSRRIESTEPNAPAELLPILIVLSGPMAFDAGQDLHPIEFTGQPDSEVFYIRYHSLPERPAINPFLQEQTRGRRTPMSQPRRSQAMMTEPVDSLAHTLKPLHPHLFDVYTPAEFRKALGNLFDEISRL